MKAGLSLEGDELDGCAVVTANGGQAGIEAFRAACGAAQSFDAPIWGI